MNSSHSPGSAVGRTRLLVQAPPRPEGCFVLYWMVAARRTRFNFALDRAVSLAHELGKPLVVLEALRSDYPHASDRLHKFAIEGMRTNARSLAGAPVTYHPYVEPHPGAGRGLLHALAAHSCAVIVDDYPCFFLPGMLERAANKIAVRCEAIDSNGLLPLAAPQKVFARAYDFRRYLQRELPLHLERFPRKSAFDGIELPRLASLPAAITRRWPAAEGPVLEAGTSTLAALPIDHSVGALRREGGEEAGARVLRRFVEERLDRYEDKKDPARTSTSGLSPYLHFGHVSAHAVLESVAQAEGWSPADVSEGARGARSGWWNMSSAAEAFLDQLVTWRELGFHFCHRRSDYDRYESLPDWARTTLARHSEDQRPYIYSRSEFEHARTHDSLWNAVQNQLRQDGRIDGYLRMLWGKKILHWSRTPQEALETMIELNDRYALDGRDPNSYSGIFWVLGRFDRPWGPERPIFGKVRYMTSDNTRRKLRVNDYVERWSGASAAGQPALF